MEKGRRLDQANVEDEDLLPFARYQPQADQPVADADTQNGNYHGNQPRERLQVAYAAQVNGFSVQSPRP